MTPPPAAPHPTRVVVLRALGLGDLLAAVPALRALRGALPDASVTLLGPRDVGGLLRDAGLVDAVVAHQGLDPLPEAVHGADLAVNLHGKGPQSHRLLRATRPGRLVGFADVTTGTVGPVWDDTEHERARWCRLVRETFGVSADPDDARISPELPEPLARAAVVVHPGAAAGSRRWPAERWAEVAARMAAHGDVVVTGSPAERTLAREVAAGASLPPESVLAGTTDVRDLAALVASARLVLSSDTGVAHLAPAFGTPSVTLFGPTSPTTWGPPPGRTHRVLWRGDTVGASYQGDPHGALIDPVLGSIEVAEVVAAAEAALAQGMRPPSVGTPQA